VRGDVSSKVFQIQVAAEVIAFRRSKEKELIFLCCSQVLLSARQEKERGHGDPHRRRSKRNQSHPADSTERRWNSTQRFCGTM
jgi:hypothetical protein